MGSVNSNSVADLAAQTILTGIRVSNAFCPGQSGFSPALTAPLSA